MKTFRSRAFAGLAAAALIAGAGLAAQDRPESILPPGFGEPDPTPTPQATRSPTAPGSVTPPAAGLPPIDAPLPPGAPTPSPTPTATPTPVDLTLYELPDYAKRGLAVVGATNEGAEALAGSAFGSASGRTIEMLMRRLDAPLPSRWLSIAMRRMLMGRLATPAGVNGADFAAERAWLLLRMGEAEGARWIVQSVDVQDYTPKLLQVAMQAMLATGDPAGLCPLVDAGSASGEPGWALARAMCAGLAGEPARAGALLDAARRRSGRGIDYLLAEKVVGAGAQGRRSVTIEWDGVDALTAWRYGLATATGVEIPRDLLSTTASWVLGWRATAPMASAVERAALSDFAASQGILSNLALVDLFAEVEASDEDGSAQVAVARDLRAAFTEGNDDQRLATLRRLWDDAEGARAEHARSVLTARAAVRIAPSAERAEHADRLVASLLTAGLDGAALRWRGIAPAGGEAAAMLTLIDPRGGTSSYGEVDGLTAGDAGPERVKAQMLMAGLGGMGRLSAEDTESLARDLNVRIGVENSWTRAIAAAAARREPATVLLLTAVGMQTGSWRGVPPEVLYHATAALRAVGLMGYARMIAAEAVARA